MTAQIPAQNTAPPASIENNRRIISLLINVISEYMETQNAIIPHMAKSINSIFRQPPVLQKPATVSSLSKLSTIFLKTVGNVIADMTEQMPLEEAAQYLNISERTLRRRIQSGKITANKIKGKWIVDINLDDNTEKTATRQQDADLAELVSQLKSENEHLRGTNQQLLSSMDEARTRSDTIIMQLSQQIDRQQLQLEDIRRNRSIFARIRDVFVPSGT